MSQHAAVYIRVSSNRQEFRSQLPDLDRWERAYADGEAIRRYTDKASGRSMDRPGWRKLEEDMAAGKISKLVVWRIDRLGRTAAGLTQLFDDLRRRKIGFVSIKDSIDLDTAAGRLLANLLASVASYENELRSERVRAGQAVARAAGKTWGGRKPGVRVKVKPEQITAIRAMAAAGKSKVEMARVTQLSRPTIYAILETEGGR